MVDWARQRDVRLQIDAVDYQASTLEIARRWSADYPEIEFREGDARKVAGGSGSYDFVFCSLALHHFNEQDAVCVLRRCRELARRAVLVADLETRSAGGGGRVVDDRCFVPRTDDEVRRPHLCATRVQLPGIL